MKLHRLAVIYAEHFSNNWNGQRFRISDIDVLLTDPDDQSPHEKIIVVASIELEHCPKVTKKMPANLVVLPRKHLPQVEKTIELVANLISIASCTKRRICSPIPSIALEAESENELSWLRKRDGFLWKPHSTAFMHYVHDIDVLEHISDLEDRLDGVALLSEALCHDHMSGKYHEYIRFFERAFRKPSRKLSEVLTPFLTGTSFGYTEQEIQGWIDRRDPLTHADQRSEFYLEAKVRPVVWRMEQAAYDILFNKMEWRSLSTDRRKCWEPICGTSSPNGEGFAVEDSAPRTVIQPMDELGVFPKDINTIIELPDNWWTEKSSKQVKLTKREFKVLRK